MVWEGRVQEPLLPLRILATRITALCTFANLVAGVGFTCGIIYPPVFFQAVAGVDASKSGLLLAPFAFTCAVSTLAAGQITDRWGGYKALPLTGMVFLGVGYGLLGTITGTTSAAEVMVFAMIAGIGVGFVMQTLLYVVQRSSSVRDIGVATSTVMLFRVLGSSLGVAVLGSAFTSSLTSEVDKRLPGFPTSEIQGAPQKIAAMAPDVQQHLQDAFAISLGTAFKVAVPFMVVGFVAVAFIPGRKVEARMAETPHHRQRRDRRPRRLTVTPALAHQVAETATCEPTVGELPRCWLTCVAETANLVIWTPAGCSGRGQAMGREPTMLARSITRRSGQ